MKTKTTTALLLLALSATAQLTITSTDPYGSHLWESENTTHWTRTIAFSNSVEIPIGSEALKLFKTEARPGPASIEIIDVRQTLRGRSNKSITNLTVVTESGTSYGWTEFRSYAPDGTEWFQWRFPRLPGATNACLEWTDCDGFRSSTNVVIDPSTPSTYTDPPKPGPRQRAGIIPTGDSDRAGDFWVTSHRVNQVFTQNRRDGTRLQSIITGFASPTNSSLILSRIGNYTSTDCFASYLGTDTWWMTATAVQGPCYHPPYRHYAAACEAASYDDLGTWDPDSIEYERLKRTSSSSVMLFVGNYGTSNLCQIRITYQWQKVISRYGTEVTHGGGANPPLVMVGSTGAKAGQYINCQDNSFVDVTPQFGATGDWRTYKMTFERWN